MAKKYDLENRLINFSVAMINVAENLHKTFSGTHIAHQLIRSGTAPALHYGEAQSAESRNDFIHKMKVALKELRETINCLRIIGGMKWLENSALEPHLSECNQLISIFVSSIATAKNRNRISNIEQMKNE